MSCWAIQRIGMLLEVGLVVFFQSHKRFNDIKLRQYLFLT